MHKILLIAALMILPLAQLGADEGKDTDLLLYITAASQGWGYKPTSVTLYNPSTQISTPLLEGVEFNNPTLGVDGRLAYSVDTDSGSDVYILDTHHPDQDAINITNSLDASEYPQVWSPDGHYLTFVSRPNASPDYSQLYVWDGTATIKLAPQEIEDIAVAYSIRDWSPDGRFLAFEVTDDKQDRWLYVWDGKAMHNVFLPLIEDVPKISYYSTNWSMDGRLVIGIQYRFDLPPSEIYLWDGRHTVNLSQNPDDADSSPSWSTDGRLAFQSRRNGKTNLLIWDGVSYRNGVPDATTFIKVAPEMTIRSFHTWTSQNQLAFVGKLTQYSHYQIYVWDGQKVVDISQNPTEDTSNFVIRDGRLAYVGYSSTSEQFFLYIRDANNQLLLKTEVPHIFAMVVWSPTDELIYVSTKLVLSSSGDLIYCTRDESAWTLGIWDGQSVRKVGHGENVVGQWQSGGSILCTSG